MSAAMHKRTAHRWRLIGIIGIATVLALGSFWLQQVMHNGELDVRADARRNEPDYIIDKFSFVRMTPDGKPHYIISGGKLTHHPLDDSADVERPFVQSITPGQPPMTMRARRAQLDHANTVVRLLGDVDIERAASPAGEHMSLKTQALTVLPDDDKMNTTEPVELMLGASTLTGNGLSADNAARVVSVLDQVHISYPAPPRH
jgi:lipopolysaccharide export system protein LptC